MHPKSISLTYEFRWKVKNRVRDTISGYITNRAFYGDVLYFMETGNETYESGDPSD